MSGHVAARRRPRTTAPTDGDRPADLLKRDFSTADTNRLWITDIPCAELNQGQFCYTAFAVDALSRPIIGWFQNRCRRSFPGTSSTRSSSRYESVPAL